MAEEFVEKVTFQADGVDEVAGQVKQLGAEAAAAHARQVALAKALADPAYRRAVDNTRRLAEANRRSLTPEVRRLTASEAARAEILRRDQALRSGAFLREQRQRDTLRRAAESVQRREQAIAQQEQLQARRREAASGQYVKRQRERLAVARQIEAVEREERRAVLDAAYGRRLGGAVAFGERNGGRLMAAGGALAAAGGAGLGMARAGFQGTVEGEAFDNEWLLLQREIAATLRPQLMMFGRAVREVRGAMEKLPRGMQDAIGWGITAAAVGGGGLLAAGSATRFLAGQNLAAFATANAPAAGRMVQGAAGAAGLTAGRLGAAGRVAGRVAPWAAVAAETWDVGKSLYDDPSFANIMRQGPVRGFDYFTGGPIARMLGYESGGLIGQAYDAIFGQAKGAGGSGQRNDLMLSGGGFQASGTGYDTLAEKLSRTDASIYNESGGGDAKGSTAEETNSLLRTMLALMQEQAGRDPPIRR